MAVYGTFTHMSCQASIFQTSQSEKPHFGQYKSHTDGGLTRVITPYEREGTRSAMDSLLTAIVLLERLPTTGVHVVRVKRARWSCENLVH